MTRVSRLIAALQRAPLQCRDRLIGRLVRFLQPGSPHADEICEVLYRYLEPRIQRLAFRIASASMLQVSGEFADGACSDLLAPRPDSNGCRLRSPRIMAYKPSRGRFGSWARRLLTNLFISRFCRQQYYLRCRPLVNASGTSQAELIAAMVNECEPAFLTEGDLNFLESWSPKKRLLILLISGLWSKIPLPYQIEWGKKYTGLYKIERVMDAETPQERMTGISTITGISRNRLSKEWSRSRGGLEQLSYIRSLREG